MNEQPVKCRDCKKTPRNCTCYEFRIETVGDNPPVSFLYVDNVATEPVRGQDARKWQPRRNAKVWRSPTYVDGYGPILTITESELVLEVQEKIDAGTFFVMDYENRGGCRVQNFDRSLERRLPFLRKPRERRNNSSDRASEAEAA